MKWSRKLGEFRGIGLYMHATFLILIIVVLLNHWTRTECDRRMKPGAANINL